MPRTVCIWLPNWPIQRLLVAQPELIGRAIVLEVRDPRRGLFVAAANFAARQAGARVGMRISELAAIKTPDDFTWEVQPHQPEEDLERLCHLAEQAQQFSPIVGLEPVEAHPWSGRYSNQPKALMIDATGLPKLFGGEDAYLQAIADWLGDQGLFGYIALASTPAMAWALANFAIPRLAKRRRSAELCNGRTDATAGSRRHEAGGPLESVCLGPEVWEEAEMLSELPIAALRIDAATVHKLHRLGVRTLNQLWQLPRDGLASRLGSQLNLRSDQALGLADETLVALHAHPDWTCQLTLEHASTSLELLQQVLDRLCHQLAGQLTKAGQGVLRCICRLDLSERPPIVMQLGLFAPCDQAQHLHWLLCGQLENLLQSLASAGPSGAVGRVCLQATLVAPVLWHQTQLFDQSQWRQKRHLAQLVDALSGRLGRDAVVQASLQRDAQPEQAYSTRPLTGRRTNGSQQSTHRKINSRLATSGAEPQPTDPLRRPIRLLQPPELLESVQLNAAGLVVQFVYQQRRYNVSGHWGPERLESGWWRGPSVRREYYRIASEDGQWWWIFQELSSGRWFLHGLFD